MHVDIDRFMEHGYLKLRNVIPADHLDSLRASYGRVVDRQRAIWARERGPDDPPGGLWETHQQPRVNGVETLIDESTANAAEVWLLDSTLGVSSEIMRAPEVAVTEMMLMCSPVRDHPGGTGWHRDFHPRGEGPLNGLQSDMMENGPSYVQWNIPLYDDNVLMIVPGSHRRPNTPEEDASMERDPKARLPGSINVELNAGDGAAYTNLIWHSGSDYSTKLRRTLHGGHCSISGPLYPYVFQGDWDMDLSFTDHLSPSGRETFQRWARLFGEQRDFLESILRSIIAKEAEGFRQKLARLHAGTQGRMMCVVTLSKLVNELWTLSRPEVASLPAHERRNRIMSRGYFDFEDNVARRFRQTEVDSLVQRFSVLDARLQADEAQRVTWGNSPPSRYVLNEMPADFDVAEFIASW